MRRSVSPWPFLPLLAVTLMASPAMAQRAPAPLTRAQFGIGYVANAPDAMVGGNAYVILPRFGGIGLYVDAKFDASSPTSERGYDASATSLQVVSMPGSTYRSTEGTWTSFNAALIRPLNPQFWLYAGGGVAKVTRYDLYDVDIDAGVGLGGVAWVENPATAETRANLMAGIMMRVSPHLTAQFGYETQPKGVAAGFSLRFPRW